MKKVFIASTNEVIKGIIRECVLAIYPRQQIIDVCDDISLMYHLKCSDDDVIFFDKFFLGYVLKFKLINLKIINNNLRIIFCELGECSLHFGFRVWDFGADGYICNISDEEDFKKKLKTVFTGQKCFPTEVMDGLKKPEYLNDKRGFSDVTDVEYQIGMYLGQGKTPKEIGIILNIARSTVSHHYYWLKRKIGFKTMDDITTLNKQMEHYHIRSWNGCKN